MQSSVVLSGVMYSILTKSLGKPPALVACGGGGAVKTGRLANSGGLDALFGPALVF